MLKKTLLVFAFIMALQLSHQKIYAQDIGAPVFKKLTFYSLGGALAGSLASLLWWATDPLNPDVSFKGVLLTGFALGNIIGFFVGVNQIVNDRVPTVLDTSYRNIYSYNKTLPQVPPSFIAEEQQRMQNQFIRLESPSLQIKTTLFQASF